MALDRYGSGSTTEAVMAEIRKTGESGDLRLCDSGDGAIDREMFFFREEIEHPARSNGHRAGQKVGFRYLYMPNVLRIDGLRGIRRLVGMMEKDVRRRWLAPMMVDIFANAMEVIMSNSITVGQPGYEEMKQAWLKKGKVYQMVYGQGQYTCYPKDDEVVFSPMLSTIDQQLATNSMPGGMGAQPVAKTVVGSDGQERIVPETTKRNRRVASEPASTETPETPEGDGE